MSVCEVVGVYHRTLGVAMTLTPEEIALDIYKTISVSLRNDAYAEYQQAQFVEQIAPIIRATVAAERERASKIVLAEIDRNGNRIIFERIAKSIRDD